ARFFQDKFFATLYFSDADIPDNLRNLVEHRNFIIIDEDLLANGIKALENHLSEVENFYTITKDFFYRYNLNVLTDIAIVMGEVSITDSHRIKIEMTDNKVKITGKVFDHELIKSLKNCINDVFLADKKNNFIGKDLRKVNILNDTQYKQIIYEWNATEKTYSVDKTLTDLFEEQVRKTPANLAISYEDKSLSYNELNKKANQLAYYLNVNYKIKPDSLVALCLDRSEYIPIAILAVLKAGGAYVPIDPDYPEERIAYILNDTKAKIILTKEKYKNRLASIIKQKLTSETITAFALDMPEDQNLLSQLPTINIEKIIASDNLAYIIYTSGTTGKPKGVMIEHKSVASLITELLEKYQISNNEKFVLFANYVFDASVEQMNLALLSGNVLHILNNSQIKDVDYFQNYIFNQKITHLHVTPSFLENLDLLKLTGLKRLISGAENLSEQLLNKCLCYIKKVFNEYGPTETTVTSLVAFNSCNIGKPISNTQVYILDKYKNPLPIGAIGELFIGGLSLARGYLNLPTLTKERFVANPFQTVEEKKRTKNARLYKTGDLARYLSDGNIEYIGRNDSQIKIRGYRVELAEIESTLNGYPEVKQSVALAHEYLDNAGKSTGIKYLVIYYVADKKLNKSAMLSHLSAYLPDYMLPRALIYLKELPLTINGKLDYKALPEPDFMDDSETYVAPRTELEVEICAIYSEVLGVSVDKISVTDDFFRLGGNSILAIKLVNKLKKELDLKINIASIFEFKTIAELAKSLLSEDASHVIISKASLNSKFYPLSFAQERLWFIKQYEGESVAYNIPMYFKINKNTNLDDLKQSLLSIIERHEVLRSLIKTDSQGNGYQLVQDIKINPIIINHKFVSSENMLDAVMRQKATHVFELE
ncbi:MAG: non-ribosomal peptide synthetase, partial [Gammaproteobacteria bacterium]